MSGTAKCFCNLCYKHKGHLGRSVNWIITDYSGIDFEEVYEKHKDKIRYLCRGIEMCPTTHKIHCQGWIQFFNKRTLGGVKRILNSKTVHLEIMRGTAKQNDAYCSKDGNFQSYGQWVTKGQRTDIENLYDRIKSENLTKEQIIELNPKLYSRCRNTIKDMLEINQRNRSKKFRKLNTSVYYGKTGTGKTRRATEDNPDAYLIQAAELKWFDGYEGQTTLIIDEYSNDVSITRLLNLLDGYQCRLPIKGSFTYAMWDKVIITSNINPKDWHENAKIQHRKALARRIHNIIKF